jgi:hypothetical protein
LFSGDCTTHLPQLALKMNPTSDVDEEIHTYYAEMLDRAADLETRLRDESSSDEMTIRFATDLTDYLLDNAPFEAAASFGINRTHIGESEVECEESKFHLIREIYRYLVRSVRANQISESCGLEVCRILREIQAYLAESTTVLHSS